MKTFIFCLLFAASVLLAPHAHAMGVRPDMNSTKAVNLNLALRDLWLAHIFWARNFVMASKLDSPDGEPARATDSRAIQNAKEIAGLLETYFGHETADRLFKLLASNYGGIKEYMNAAHNGRADEKDRARALLKKNAAEMAEFLGSTIRQIQHDQALKLLTAHGEFQIAQIDALSNNDFISEANIWDGLKGNTYSISDAVAEAIVKQFPEKF